MIMLVVFGFLTGMLVRSALYGSSLSSSHHAYVDAYDQYRRDAGFRVLVGCSRHVRFEHSSSIWIRRWRCSSDPPQRSGVDSRACPRRTVATQEPSGLILPFRFRALRNVCQLEHPECPEG